MYGKVLSRSDTHFSLLISITGYTGQLLPISVFQMFAFIKNILSNNIPESRNTKFTVTKLYENQKAFLSGFEVNVKEKN